jgi:hypothetical protein
VVERERLERDAVERDAVDREAVEREPVERLLARDPPLRDEPEPELARVLRVVEDGFVLVTAARSLSNSLSASRLVFAALRRSADSALVTSL